MDGGFAKLGMDYKLGGFILGLMTISTAVFFGVISLDMGGVWSGHVKALYLITYILLVFIIIIFLKISDKETKRKNEIE